MKKHIFIINLLLLIGFYANGQDNHYSQIQNAPLFLNPSLTGDLDYQQRIGGIYRSQWANINTAYTSYGVFYDRKVKKLNYGLMVNQNSAGESSIQLTNAVLSAAYKQRLSLTKENYLSIGGQLGIGQKRFDPTAFSFDNQIDLDNGFDPSLSNGETFSQTTAIVPDFNVGIAYSFGKSGGTEGIFGLAFYHLLNSKASFYDTEQIFYPRKTMFYGKVQIPFSSKLKIGPRLLVMSQEQARETMLGVHGKFNIQEELDVNFGIDARFGDAVVFQIGVDRRNLTVGLSYDANTSNLSGATNGNGAIELSAIYRFGSRRTPVIAVDTDGDGILDAVDDCPTVAGIKKLKGCPPIDTDGDGILDKDDKCPTVPGIKRLQGCPPVSTPLDSDGDGILDKDDKCPTVPGIKSLQGCPPVSAPLDSDGDGILDKDDKCPTVPGVVALQGCPETTGLKDSDGDGIYDNEDLCPYNPGLRMYRGCNDIDQDGVWDHIDVCPRIYGVARNNGCPINDRNLDSDGDGILDKNDKCIYLRGSIEHEGCPDSDKDGVSDIEDDCPFIKGIRANAGCPLENQPAANPTPISPTNPREIAIEAVEFDTDKSFIKPFYFARLDNVVSIVRANPNYRVILSGHTDSEGNTMYNYQLGQRRAQEVQNYLVRKGVSPYLIEIKSYGEAIPKTTNSTEEGKARNRRTEIIILEY